MLKVLLCICNVLNDHDIKSIHNPYRFGDHSLNTAIMLLQTSKKAALHTCRSWRMHYPLYISPHYPENGNTKVSLQVSYWTTFLSSMNLINHHFPKMREIPVTFSQLTNLTSSLMEWIPQREKERGSRERQEERGRESSREDWSPLRNNRIPVKPLQAEGSDHTDVC